MDCVRRSHNSRKQRNKKEGIKVVYISTPMKVKTSASKFRALVQELTGRHSDTARLMMEDRDHDHAPAPQSSSEDSFSESVMFNQEQHQPWEQESFDGHTFPFSSLFVNDQSNFSYYYHDQLEPVSGFASTL